METVRKIIRPCASVLCQNPNNQLHLQIMKLVGKIISIAGILLFTSGIYAQHNSKDSLLPLRELVQLRQMYKNLPVELQIHIQNSASPITTADDSLQADMDAYYDDHNFYMKTEGLEQIVNDSMIVLVNNPGRTILLYPNNRQLIMIMEQSAMAIVPDSSIERLAKKYVSFTEISGQDEKRIELRSRNMVYGTQLPSESLIVTYNVLSHQPLEFKRARTLLVPIDSDTYKRWKNDSMHDGKIISISRPQGDLFFLVKELTTVYRFDKITFDVRPPVKENDRIIKGTDGNYVVAKGFEQYVLSKEY